MIMIEYPLIMILLTLSMYTLSEKIFKESAKHPLLHPFLLTILLIISVLYVFDISYLQYREGTQILNVLIGPAIVSLAVPLYQNLKQVKSSLGLIIITILIAGTGIFISALLLGEMMGLTSSMVQALSTKSITLPIALEITGLTNIPISLVVLGVFSTGLAGIIIVPMILRFLKVKDESIQGLVLGVTAHVFGIAKALDISQVAAAFATIGMVLMGCFSVLIVPIILRVGGF